MQVRRQKAKSSFGLEKIVIAGALILCLIMITASDFKTEPAVEFTAGSSAQHSAAFSAALDDPNARP